MGRLTIRKAIIFSLALHGCLVLSALFCSEYQPQKHPSSSPLAIELIDANVSEKKIRFDHKKAKALVEQDHLNDEVDPNAQYLSSHNQKVIQETVVKNHGMFQNRPFVSDGVGHATAQNSKGQPTTSETSTRRNLAGEPLADEGKTIAHRELFGSFKDSLLKQAEAQRQREEDHQKRWARSGEGESSGSRGSQTRDYLPNKEFGAETILSTREFIYFTYYNRIRDRLSQFWEPQVRRKMIELMKRGRRIASTEDRITKLQIILDGQGVLKNVQILSASGVIDLDSVAIDAFKAAAPFPNPPKGIIEADGTVKIQWDFVIES